MMCQRSSSTDSEELAARDLELAREFRSLNRKFTKLRNEMKECKKALITIAEYIKDEFSDKE